MREEWVRRRVGEKKEDGAEEEREVRKYVGYLH